MKIALITLVGLALIATVYSLACGAHEDASVCTGYTCADGFSAGCEGGVCTCVADPITCSTKEDCAPLTCDGKGHKTPHCLDGSCMCVDV